MENFKKLTDITSTYSVLYVEDDRESALHVIEHLSHIFKEVVFAENGKEALNFYTQMNFEIVFTDITMPVMDGLDLSAEIRKIKKNQKIVIISGYTDIELFISSIQLGIDGYVIKPIQYTNMHNLLYKMAKEIENTKKEEEHEQQIQKFFEEISQKNNELYQYQEILDHVALVSKADLNGNIIYANDYFSEVSGYSHEELIGSNHNIVKHPAMPKSIFKNLWDTIKNGNIWKGSLKNQTKYGETYFVNTIIMPIFDKDKIIKEYLNIMFLTTQEENEKRNFKKKVLSSYQELRKINYEISKKNELLEQSLKMLNDNNLIENISEDKIKIKNQKLLTQIKFFEDELRKKELLHFKSIEKASLTLRDTNDLYKKALLKIKSLEKENEFIKNDNILRKKEITELKNKLKNQNTIIVNLKNANMKEEKESKEEKSFFNILK